MEVDIVVSPIRCTSMPHEGGGENKSQSDIGEQGLLENSIQHQNIDVNFEILSNSASEFILNSGSNFGINPNSAPTSQPDDSLRSISDWTYI